MSVCQPNVLKATSLVTVVRSAGTTYFSANYFNATFSFHWISILLISVTFYTYLAKCVFSCDLAFKYSINLRM